MVDTIPDLADLSLYALASEGENPGLFTNSVDTMLAISHSIEEAVIRHRLRGTFYAGFQRLSAFNRQMSHYRRLAAICGEVVVFAFPDEPMPEIKGVTVMALDEAHPLVDEWFIVFAASQFLVSLMTRQLDDQLYATGRGRLYEGVVTMRPRVVLEAQARLARALGQPPAREQLVLNADQDTFSPLFTFNTEMIGYLEGRNRQLSAMYRRVNEQKLSLEQLQAIVRTMLSRTAWEEAQSSQRDPQAGIQAPEKEQLTVLVSDIQGFTRLAGRWPLVRVVQDLNLYFDLLASAVYQENGDVDKFMGDGMLAFFQTPDAGLRAARLIQERVAEFNEQREVPFRTRLALVTGPCIVARLGSRDRQEVTILGDTVNLASRLEGHAPPGGLIMDERTYRVCQVPGAEAVRLEIAGKQAQVPAFLLREGQLAAKEVGQGVPQAAD